MNIFKKNEKKNTTRLPMPDKVKKGYRYYCSLVAAVALMGCCTMTAFAAPAGGDPLPAFQRLPDPGGRRYHHLCQGDSDPYHRLIAQSYPNTRGRLTGWACPLKRRCFACRIIG